MAKRIYDNSGRKAEAENTRSQLIAAARKILSERGHRTPFSMDAVAKKAGVARATVYLQFESRGSLLEAVFDTIANEGGLGVLPEAFTEPDPVEALKKFTSVFVRFWIAQREVWPRLSRELADDEAGARLTARSERRRRGITVIVGRLAQKLTLDRADDLIDALHGMTSYEFIGQLIATERSEAEVEALMLELVEAVIRSLCFAKSKPLRNDEDSPVLANPRRKK
ncbi:TetR/AcrR family transcriptional regulator [Afipia sp. GAS231]|uniref:TetR/AcrR family transcriptional regulator n=1 Tax=Afipia sp. GAS231 TaxID=1882747 RepID=UPI00087B9B1D|nr:TetR/AcrR family transcriptional regulator [Afipia sp. GAS231]SDO46984.1 transcriptional regulator, TetR family [Afipia sp. GAS231]